MALTLVNTDNAIDSPFLAPLAGATSVVTASFGGRTFLYVASYAEDAIVVFEVGAGGNLIEDPSAIHVVFDSDDPGLELSGARALVTGNVGGQTFLFCAGLNDDGVSSFAALANGALVNTHNLDDANDPAFELLGAEALATAIVSADGGDSVTFLFVAGRVDNGISVFSVSDDGFMSQGQKIDDSQDPALELLGVSGIATAIIRDTTFVFAAGRTDNGISVFEFDLASSPGPLVSIVNLDDSADPALELAGAVALTTAVVGTKTFLFVAGAADDGISVFQVAANGALTNVDNVSDDATLNLNNVVEIGVAKIAGTTYLFTAASEDNGVSVFAVAADGTLINVANIDDGDDPDFELEGASGVAIAQIGGEAFLFVPGADDNGISVFRIDVTGLTINGTSGNDVINALDSAPSQLLPSELGDVINGFGGNDTLEGLGGDDALTGGAGKDALSGDAGADKFNYDLVLESLKGAANRDVIEDFSRAQGDKIDLFDIDAKTGMTGNQTFKFIGAQKFHKVKGELHFVKKSGFVIVEGDVNGDGKADFQIQVDNVAKLAAGDFVL